MVGPWAAELSQNAAKYATIDLGDATNRLWRLPPQGEGPANARAGTWDSRGSNGGSTSRDFARITAPTRFAWAARPWSCRRSARVAMVEELRFRGSIREVTINRTAGTWFACFCIEDDRQVPPG